MSQFINNPEHTFGFDTLQLHVAPFRHSTPQAV